MQNLAGPPWESAKEWRVSLFLTGAVLLALTCAKLMAHLPYVGPVALTAAAFLQLSLPVNRADAHQAPMERLGLTWSRWRSDLRLTTCTLAIILPPYAVAYHLFVTQGQALITRCGFESAALWLPHGHWAPHLPMGPLAWGLGAAWLGERVATHTLGVALPEEVFYRGYLQPCLQWRWPATQRLWGTPLGGAVVLTAALFALGHFLGEWTPLRLGPFFPALLFGWLRNRSGTVMAAIGVHAGCNIFVELFSRLYVGG